MKKISRIIPDWLCWGLLGLVVGIILVVIALVIGTSVGHWLIS